MPRKKPSENLPHALLAWAHRHREEMLRWIGRAVEIESPSFTKAAVDQMGEFLATEFGAAGGKVQIHRHADAGNHVQVDFLPNRSSANSHKPILLVGHHDTVWELGTLSKMPFRIANGRLWGPGTLDMKTGLAQIVFAIRALQQMSGGIPRPVTVLSVTDEEIGSHSSRALTEQLAKKSAAVLVLEPAQGLQGALKTARKGVGEYRLRVRGKAAHAGVDFPAGGSAIVELSKQIQKISGFTNLEQGITVNPGVISGGTRTNVVAAEAEVRIDVRILRASQAKPLDKKLHNLKPFDKRCRLELSGGLNRPPMERSRAGVALFAKAQALAAATDARGWKLKETSTGGASDGNFTAALGIPTLDGLGAVGEGAHAAHESVLIAEPPRRTALLAALIAEI